MSKKSEDENIRESPLENKEEGEQVAGEAHTIKDGFISSPIGKSKGYVLVIIGLSFGILQALFTIPNGGGALLLVIPGAFVGASGFILMAFRNKFSSNKVKIGALIAAGILILALILSIFQINVILKTDEEMDELDKTEDEIDQGNWTADKRDTVEKMDKLLTSLNIVIIVLAIATGLITISVTIPSLMGGNDNKRWLMLIPLILSILAIISAVSLTLVAMSDLKEGINNFESADTLDEYLHVYSDFNWMNIHDFILGSQIGGALNLIALIFAILFSYGVKVDIRPHPPKIKRYPEGIDPLEVGLSEEHRKPNICGLVLGILSLLFFWLYGIGLILGIIGFIKSRPRKMLGAKYGQLGYTLNQIGMMGSSVVIALIVAVLLFAN